MPTPLMILSPYQQRRQQRLMETILPVPALTVDTSPRNAALLDRNLPSPPQMTMPEMETGQPEDPLAQVRRMRQRYMEGAPQGIDPRIAEVLARREARLAEQEGEISRSARQTPWEALMRAGAAMAASQSPFFGQALAAGTTTALNTIQQRRAEQARQRMLLGEGRDEIEMERINQEGAGRRAAAEAFKGDMAVAGDLASLEARRAEAQEKIARAAQIADPEMRALELAKARAELRSVNALTTQRLAAAAKDSRDGGGRTSDVEARADRQELDKAAAEYEAAREVFNRASQTGDLTPEVEQEMLGRKARLRQLSRAFARNYGSTPYPLGGEAVGRVAPTSPRMNTQGWSAQRL